jgi:S-adenosyl-L-methionine hydrolase (adenosine-forming)
MPTVTLTTDFGLGDSYVAQMKGVILSLCPGTLIVDISHQVPPHDVVCAARLLKESAPHFPGGTIHLAVVDPEVGTSRRRTIVEAEVSVDDSGEKRGAVFVGPDNGIFSLAAPAGRRRAVWEITELGKLPRADMLSTFDGRDVFAPVAAMLARGKEPSYFGPALNETSELNALIEPSVSRPVVEDSGAIIGEILYFDHFGNAVTNIDRSVISSREVMAILPKSSSRLHFVDNYKVIPENKAGVLLNSQGLLEIAANKRSAKELLNLAVGDKLLVHKL